MSGDISPSVRKASDRPFRRLSKNDVYQTVAQWRERALQELGSISGQWTYFVERDSVPKLPEERPRAPVKPTTEALMLPLKQEIRQARLADMINAEARAAATEGRQPVAIALESVPLPSDYDAWSEYEYRRGRYEDAVKEYEWQVKQAREVFPIENRKVFPSLIECISDASVQDLKRTEEGAALFEDHDAYGFFKLAITEHEYLPPAISSAAVARAKEDFEGLRQKSEDGITEHVNEFRRRLEALVKARGPDGGSPYLDFDLRDLLLNSLYKPLWGSWIATREACDNMPTTFEGVVLALKKAESTMILRGMSALDIQAPTSHATTSDRSSEPSTPKTPLPPNRCVDCSTMFCPRRATYTRCDPCQKRFAAQKKEGKGKPPGKPKGKKKGKVTHKKAHATLGDEGSSEDSSDEDDEDEEDTAKALSFSCICATRASCATEGNMVYFDNCSNLNIIKDRELAIDVRTEKVRTRISGSIPGSFASNQSANIGDLGRGCFDPMFSRNLISESAVLNAGYRVKRDSGADNNYYLCKDGRLPLVFSINSEGTYSTTAKVVREHFKDLYATANHTDVRREMVVFTKRQRERAARYHYDHEHCLGHMHPERVIKALRTGMITDVPYTEADVRNALIIHGECPTCSKTKGVRHRQTGTYPVLPAYPGERLAGDLFTIMGILFAVISCRLIKLRCVTRLQNKGAMEVVRAIRETVGLWNGYGSKPRVLSWDQEPAVVSCASELWAKHSLRMEFVAPDSHERVAERDVRTIKEHVYASILSLNHAVDEEMVEGIVRDTVTLLNFMPNSETVEVSPRSMLDGERLNYSRWSRVYAGQVGEFEIPYVSQNKRGVRREIGYVLGHQGDNPVVRLLPSGRRLVVRSGHVKTLEKTTAMVQLIEQGITGAKRQRYNDLLSEIADFYANGFGSEDDPKADERPLQPVLDKEMVEPEPEWIPPSTPIFRERIVPERPREVERDLTPSPDEPHVDQRESLVVPPPERALEIPSPQPVVPTSPQVEEVPRPTRRGAQKPPGFYAKLNKGESAADYTACHMRADECELLYGEEATLEAGVAEVVNMIGRNAAVPEDYRLLSEETIKGALPSFLFYKAKVEIVEVGKEREIEVTTENEGWQVVSSKRKKKRRQPKKKTKIKGRWVGGGHRQKRADVLAERVAPTARSATHGIVMAIAAFEGRELRIGDIPAAYLQAEHVPADGKPVYIIADRHTTKLIVKAYPDKKKLVRPNGTMILRVAKAMYGLVESASLWYRELETTLKGIGYSVAGADRALFYKKVMRDGKCIASNLASVHVDDIASAASNNPEGKALQDEFWSTMEGKWPGVKLQCGPHYKHLSWNIYQDPVSKEIRRSQKDYLMEVVKTVGVAEEQKLPCRSDLLTSKRDSPLLAAKEASKYRSILQKVAYAREGRPDFDFVVSYLQGTQSEPTTQNWNDLMHLLAYVKRVPEREVVFRPKDLQLRAYADAAFNIYEDGRSHYGYVVTLGGALICSKGGRIKTVVRSSTEAEITAVNEVVSDLLWCRDVLEELGYQQKVMAIREDNKSCITMLQQEPRNFQSKSKHVRVKWAFYRQEHENKVLCLKYCPTEKMVADLLTKPLGGKAHNLHSSKLFDGV